MTQPWPCRPLSTLSPLLLCVLSPDFLLGLLLGDGLAVGASIGQRHTPAMGLGLDDWLD